MNTDSYVPDLPEAEWGDVRVFVLSVVDDVKSAVPYPLASLVNAVAHHVDWAVNVAGYEMTRELLFSRDLIAAAVTMMPTTSPSTKGRRRSLLFRVGEALRVLPTFTPLTPLSAATPTTPYNELDIRTLRTWAHLQRSDQNSRSARALIALGLGAGLPTRDIGAVTAASISMYGDVVHVSGRDVPVRPRWHAELAELGATASARDAWLFQPHIARSKNFVTLFVNRTIGAGVRPSTQRMRSTWLVQALADGVPMQNLLSSAGLQSMDALTRYQRFLPAPSAVVLRGSPQ
ncbi:hypothetical protein [Microbacterium sp. Mcb102]|uniref:hypothetical protein n=1 Tax=Microbacterium sp. Mcb102 TaxID=2926012 RepID=UPI0021C708C7|nr:hypothetical protein [Microbacterium sp. Mcb102]